MKAATAAKKLGIYLPATPAEFQEGDVTREQFDELQSNPPGWLADLRRDGPHPRPVVAQKLNVTISGLARGGVTEPLTSEEIGELLQNRPQWLVDERANMASVREEQKRVRDASAAKAQKKVKADPRHYH
jgi:broad specificity phosphatase PhoE